MKNIFKFFGIGAIMLFSFYYTEKIALYAQSQSPIMKDINEAKENLYVASVDAKVTNNYIIPGINGLSVNVDKSYDNMKSFKVFNSYYLIFDQIQPDISIENNKDKIIKQGNPKKRNVSFIIEENELIKEYFKENNIKANILMNLDNYDKTTSFEILNNETKNFRKFDSILTTAKKNSHICLLNKSNKQECLEREYYLLLNNKELNGSNIAEVKSNITSGDIILIKSTANLEDFKLLINQIKYKDLNVVYLSELITEENN